MKRSITELENNLIEKGFKLSYKTYRGKHSQYVDDYVYRGKVQCDLNSGESYSVQVKVIINSKKNSIKSIWIGNNCRDFVNVSDIAILRECYSIVNNYVRECETLCQE